jgi:pimeloyl-ACP methyl ester carboxylesterase
VSQASPAYLRYETGGGEEWMMRIGAAADPALLILPPLFEEMNRTRALLASAMRLLAGRGLGCWLPDLPGTGESPRALADCGWADWREAAGAAGRRAKARAVVSVRGGALLDGATGSPFLWRLSPVEGASLARDLERAGLVSGGGAGGYAPGEALMAGLRGASPGGAPALRTVRLESDPGAADFKVDAPPLWRRSEPGNSSELAEAMAWDIEQWVRRCGAC